MILPKTKDIWDRWNSLWKGLFILITMVCVGIALTDASIVPSSLLIILLLSGVMIGWRLLLDRLPENGANGQPLLYIIYFSVGWLLWYLLVSFNTAFLWLLAVLFPHVFATVALPWSVVLAIALNTLVLLRLQIISPDLTRTWMSLILVTTLSGLFITRFITDVINQSRERREMMEKLTAAQKILAETQHQAGILQERQRLAGELHDTVAQGLIGIVMQLEAAENFAGSDTGATQTYIHRAKNLARENLQEIRTFIQALRPTILEKFDFQTAIKQWSASWSQQNGIPIQISFTGEVRQLPQALEEVLLRVLQEGLTNIARHAQATQVSVTFSFIENLLTLTVIDNGVGFKLDEVSSESYGLHNIRLRLAPFQGTFQIHTILGEGSSLTIQIPLNDAVRNSIGFPKAVFEEGNPSEAVRPSIARQ
jgi:signal transduction histidine kinase